MTIRRFVVVGICLLASSAAHAQWVTSGANEHNANGNVGIGTTNPTAARLVLAGSTSLYAGIEANFNLTANAGATNIGMQIAPTSKVAANTFVGINAIVDQFGAGSGTVDTMVGLVADARHWDPIAITSMFGSRYQIHNRGTGTITTAAGSFIADAVNNGGGAITTQYGLYLQNQTKGVTNYAIYAAGGQSYLGGLLTVAGDVNVAGNIAAKYQDVAEWVPTDKPIPYGTVVIIDPNTPNQVVPSSTAYDTSVAGVISERPGLALGEASASKVLVATTGRLRTKVDASNGEIKIGDLLVTSDKPGVAMKSQPMDVGGRKFHQPGTVVGKALEPLKSGQGEILVLLSLQ